MSTKAFHRVESVVFDENPYGGWYAVLKNGDGKILERRYYLFAPRWWFHVVAKRALKKGDHLGTGSRYVR